MNWFTLVQDKLDAMRQYCIDQSAIDCLSGDVSNSQTRYNFQFDTLENAIAAYISNITNKESQLKDIIQFDFINVMKENVTHIPPISNPTAPFPDGYDDYWALYSMNGFVDTLLAYNDSYFYQGCIISPSGTTANLQSAITTVNSSEAQDVTKRNTFLTFLQQYNIINSLILLTENMEIEGTFRTKQQTGEIIYNTKHAKEIIDSFSLDVYIPTYITG